MKKGFTLIEVMLVISIIVILTTAGITAAKGSSERNAKIKMRTQIPTYLTTEMNRAYERGENYQVQYVENLNEKRLETYHNSNLVSKLNLSDNLVYAVSPSAITISAIGVYKENLDLKVSNKNNELIFTVKIDSDGKRVSNIVIE